MRHAGEDTATRQRQPGPASQKELRTSEIRYRRLFETARDGILILDAVTRQITDVNPFMVELLGYTRDEFMGKELFEIGLLKDEQASAAAFRELQESGYIRYEDLPLQTKWGKRREVEFVSNVYAENGHQVIQCNIRDITERKRAERALRESGDCGRFLAESMPQKIFTAKPNGDVDYVNQQWAEFAGLPLRRIKDWGWSRFVHPDDLAATVWLWQHSIDTGVPFQCEHRFRRTDGTYRWHLSRAHAMRDADGQVLMWISSNTDIDDQKRTEVELQQLIVREQAARNAAEAANHTKDAFLATVSHELRTPLTAILGWAVMLRRAGIDAADTIRGLVSIERNARAQAQLIEDILDISRIAAGKLVLELRPLALAPIISAVLESTSPDAAARAVHVDAHLQPDIGLVSGDASRLQQVISNLLSNAIKFTPSGGHVAVRLRRLGDRAEITVTDSGQGIHAQFLPHVFDHFRQADSTSTRTQSGLGLGLAIVHNIVEMHGGTVQAASQGAGQGATFTLSLPLLAFQSAAPAGDQQTAPLKPDSRFDGPAEIKGLRVVIVDDDTATLEMLSALLQQCGAVVRTSELAATALEVIRQWQPDLLVSDIAMPAHDGLWLIEQVRALEARGGTRMPALALTAYVRVEDRASVLESGFDMFLPKPIEPAELVATVASLVRTTA